MLARLRLRDFRNLAELDWIPGAGRHLLLGPNGAGKTSILEAIYVVATTRSFRTARLAECRRHGTPGFWVRGEVAGAKPAALEVGDAETGRHRTLDGEDSRLAEHLQPLPVLSWSEADQGLIAGGPEARRRFVDRGILARRPGTLAVLGRYRKILHQKRALVAAGGTASLGEWNRLLAASGAELVALRRSAVAELQQEFDALRAESGLDLPRVELRYRSSPAAGRDGEGAFLAALEAARDRELATGRVLLGPHRDEVALLWPQRVEVRRQASAGERKAVGLGLLAAQARILAAADREPTLLLDDLDTELDPARLATIWSLFGSFRQLFVTSNRPAVWSGLDELSAWRMGGAFPSPERVPATGP